MQEKVGKGKGLHGFVEGVEQEGQRGSPPAQLLDQPTGEGRGRLAVSGFLSDVGQFCGIGDELDRAGEGEAGEVGDEVEGVVRAWCPVR